MRSFLLFLVSMSLWDQVNAEEITVDGVFGECLPIMAAAQEGLILHTEPNKGSLTRSIFYRKGWKILYSKSRGLTRVIKRGSVRALRDLDNCGGIEEGETGEYLYYLGEGSAVIKFNEKTCYGETYYGSEDLEVLELPEIESWLPVYLGDGSSPGWILFDDPQMKTVGVEC